MIGLMLERAIARNISSPMAFSPDLMISAVNGSVYRNSKGCAICLRLRLEDQVTEAVDRRPLAGVNHRGRRWLFDDRRAGHVLLGRHLRALVDLGLQPA